MGEKKEQNWLNRQFVCGVLAVLLYAAEIASLIFVSDTVELSIAILTIELFLQLWLWKRNKAALAGTAASIVFNAVWLWSRMYIFYLLGVYSALLVAILIMACMWQQWVKSKNPKGVMLKRVVTTMFVVGFGISVVVAGVLSVTAATSVPMIKFMQKYMMHAENSYEEEPSEQKTVEGGTCLTNIQYGNTYPNSYLDIYLTDENPEQAPTYFFIHGGGNVWGDKQEGDPNGGDTGEGGLAWYIRQFLDNGYNVVSPNYALAPDYTYPTPILQLNEALEFLELHGVDYGLNMQELIIGGNSGGGQMTGALICIQLNPEYATLLGTHAVLEVNTVKAAIFSSAMINMYEAADTGDFGADYLFLQCGKAYYGWEILEKRGKIPLFSDYLTEDFPDSFISDGNTGTFYEQAFDLHSRMDELGIRNEINWYPADEAILGHDFETRGTKYSVDNFNKIVSFLEKSKM